jgi:uncharacterized protein (TIGR02594 family)
MTRPTGPYAWLNAEPGPRMLLEALKLFGTAEVQGPGNNPVILGWADEIGGKAGATAYSKWAAKFYEDDSGIAWCGLMMAICAVRANVDNRPDRAPPDKFLAAASWATFGVPVAITDAQLGDVLVFWRDGGGHVGLYVGEDADSFHVLGGNQGDAVTIRRISKARCTSVRRPPYLNKPANVRPIRLAAAGTPSTNEA